MLRFASAKRREQDQRAEQDLAARDTRHGLLQRGRASGASRRHHPGRHHHDLAPQQPRPSRGRRAGLAFTTSAPFSTPAYRTRSRTSARASARCPATAHAPSPAPALRTLRSTQHRDCRAPLLLLGLLRCEAGERRAGPAPWDESISGGRPPRLIEICRGRAKPLPACMPAARRRRRRRRR